MTIEELANRVKAVRDAQKAYFATRDKAILATSKRLERELDATVDGVLGPVASGAGRREPLPGQGGLFKDADD